jgi:splicing factor 3A subunit 2
MFGADRGSKVGTAGVASSTQANVQRRERLRALALETVDITNDPYFMKNNIGKYECKLCLTLHTNEGSYLSHTQGKKHQQNLARRAARLAQQQGQFPLVEKKKIEPRKTVKIGRPGYKVVKQRDPETNQRSILFQVAFPQIEGGLVPRFRFMSAYEQRVEPPDDKFQYICFAAEPYETIAFKIPNVTIDKSEGKFFTHWDEDSNQFTFQFYFEATAAEGGMAAGFDTNVDSGVDAAMGGGVMM